MTFGGLSLTGRVRQLHADGVNAVGNDYAQGADLQRLVGAEQHAVQRHDDGDGERDGEFAKYADGQRQHVGRDTVQCGCSEPDGNGDGDVQQQGCGDGGAGNIRGLVADGDGVRQLHDYGATQSATITPKALTYSGLSVPSSMPYNGTTTAMVSGTASSAKTESAGSGSTSDGIPYSGDAVSLTGTATGTYNSKDVATASPGDLRRLVADGDWKRQL